jgi:thioredoxin 1
LASGPARLLKLEVADGHHGLRRDFRRGSSEAKEPVVVDFWAEWCPPCGAIGPALEDIAGSMNGKVKIVKLNIDENPAIAPKYGIMSIPTLTLFKDAEPTSHQICAQPKTKLQQWITAAV